MLNVSHINVFYGSAQVLWDISLKVDEGSLVAVVGSNGAGKTTTLKTISGLLQPKSGEIYFQGSKINGLPPHVIAEKGISLVPEGRRLFPFLTVQENLEMGAYTKNARKNIENTMDFVFQLFPKLRERKKQLAYTLSGGEQQMLAVGRALMAKPRLLMLDEPSLGLAPSVVSNIFNILRELNTKGLTIFLVEQNIQTSLKIAHNAYVMENGKVVLEGTGSELLNNDFVKKTYLGI